MWTDYEVSKREYFYVIIYHYFIIFVPLTLICFSFYIFFFGLSVQRLTSVLSSITERENTESESMDLLHKFRKQTVRRLQHLQDIKKVTLLAVRNFLFKYISYDHTTAGNALELCCSYLAIRSPITSTYFPLSWRPDIFSLTRLFYSESSALFLSPSLSPSLSNFIEFRQISLTPYLRDHLSERMRAIFISQILWDRRKYS